MEEKAVASRSLLIPYTDIVSAREQQTRLIAEEVSQASPSRQIILLCHYFASGIGTLRSVLPSVPSNRDKHTHEDVLRNLFDFAITTTNAFVMHFTKPRDLLFDGLNSIHSPEIVRWAEYHGTCYFDIFAGPMLRNVLLYFDPRRQHRGNGPVLQLDHDAVWSECRSRHVPFGDIPPKLSASFAFDYEELLTYVRQEVGELELRFDLATKWLEEDDDEGEGEVKGNAIDGPVERDGESQRELPEGCKRSTDFRHVIWFGRDYTFSKRQAAAVAVMWRHWLDGVPEVGDTDILDATALDKEKKYPAKRMNALFRGHAAWGEMIVKGSTRGTHRLNELPRISQSKKKQTRAPNTRQTRR